MAKKANQLRVKVVNISETQVFESGFRKRTMEGLIEGEYPQEFEFEFTQDNVDILDDVLEDTYVTVSYNLRSRKITENKDGVKYEKPLFFTSLNAYRVDTK